MKKITSIIASVALLFGVSTAAQAQERDYSSAYNYVSVQAGAQVTPTNYPWFKLVTPQYAISAGRYFNDKVGARIHVMGYKQRGGYRLFDQSVNMRTYSFKACTADADLLVNMTNVIAPGRYDHSFDWVLLAGFGTNYAWNFDDFNENIAPQQFFYNPQECGTKHSTFNGRLGTQFNYNISEAFTIGVELQANYKNDMFNLKHNDKVDWQFVGLVGVTYNFGYKKKEKTVTAPTTTANVYDQAEAEAEAARAAAKKAEAEARARAEQAKKAAETNMKVEKPKDEPLKEVFFYVIRESNPDPESTINKIVEWCNKYPSKSISIKGYADRGTGTAKINKMYAMQRAQKVAKQLQAKGISAQRMTVDSYGDTVQPYSENDKNRCVIVVGE